LPPNGTLILRAIDDAHVIGNQATTNFGESLLLSTDTSPATESYLKFNLQPFAAVTIQQATLRMFVDSTSANAQNIKEVTNDSWEEETITFNTKPAKGATSLATFTPATDAVFHPVGLTSHVNANKGTIMSLVVDSTGSDSYRFNSDEALSNRLELVVCWGAGCPTPTPTVTPSPSPSVSPTPTVTVTPTPAVTPSPSPGGACPTPAPAANLTALPISADTGEKPQDKVWFHACRWWAVFPTSGGTHVYRLDGNAWTQLLQLSTETGTHADVKSLSTGVAHVLLYDASTQLVSIQFQSSGCPSPQGSPCYQLWPTRTTPTNITLPAGHETATIDIDSTGRMWLATTGTTMVRVLTSPSPYTTFTAVTPDLATGINDDDNAVVTALPNGTVGVLWSDQETGGGGFGFKYHVDGANVNTWSALEIPAIGGDIGDDHLNVAVDSRNSTLYAAVKTTCEASCGVTTGLLVRRLSGGGPGGTWDPIYNVDTAGTRGIVTLNEAANRVRVTYTASTGGNNIVTKTSPISSISFGSATTLGSGSFNNATSTKQNMSTDLVILWSDYPAAPFSARGTRLVNP
jgi:hypothetical protein